MSWDWDRSIAARSTDPLFAQRDQSIVQICRSHMTLILCERREHLLTLEQLILTTAKQSKAEIAGAGQSLCAYQITKNAMYMYNYRAVLVIHVRQTSVTDSGQINFVIKQHLDWTNTQYLSRLFLKLSTESAEITDSSRLFQIFTTLIANSK